MRKTFAAPLNRTGECVKIGLSEESIKLYDDFIGVGYLFYDVRPTVLLIFDKKKKLVNTWNKIIKWWPDDEIKIRFVERHDSFEFVLYGESRIVITKWIFVKTLKASEHYKRFKDDYDGATKLGLALYIPKDESYQLELFRHKKRVTDVIFLKEAEAEQDATVLMSRQIVNTTRHEPD